MDLNTILSWFKRGCKPTEAQFAATFRSFRHKDDPVPMEDVTGLSYALANKSEKGHTHTLAEITDYDGGDKEVLNAMVANDTAELEAFTKTVGMYYILLADQTLYQYVHDEDTDTDTLTEVDPDGKVVYSAYDADNNLHIYLYNVPNMEFQDVTNEQVDKTIYTNDLDTLITRQLKNGIYSVVHINSGKRKVNHVLQAILFDALRRRQNPSLLLRRFCVAKHEGTSKELRRKNEPQNTRI